MFNLDWNNATFVGFSLLCLEILERFGINIFFKHILNDFAVVVFLSNFIKIFEKLWKPFEFIHYSVFVKNTCASTMSLYTHVLVIKMGVCYIYAHSLFVWDSKDIRCLRCTMLEFVSATFRRRNT